jgi:AcrR family transcriptional regulator
MSIRGDLVEKFRNLPDEKQKVIIDAALTAFGTNGYKKTSVSDIANAAGISKAMVFHYFGTKKALYLFLMDYSAEAILKQINDKFDSTIPDFFDRILQSSRIKVEILKSHPAIPSFLNSVYFEEDKEVKGKTEVFFARYQRENLINKIAFEGMDASKFKDGIDPKLVFKMLTWLSYGYLNKSNTINMDYGAVLKEFEECIYLLKNNFYKEQYL